MRAKPRGEIALLTKAVGGLSWPSKMPCHSWSIPAKYCKLGAKLVHVEDSPCFDCYALKGFYMWPNAREAMERRYAILLKALNIDARRKLFVSNFSELLNQKLARWQTRSKFSIKDHRYFRWHDSGDLQSTDHLRIINEIAELTPDVQHWLPTREFQTVDAFLLKETIVPNLMIRISMPTRKPSPSVLALAGLSPQVTLSTTHLVGTKPLLDALPCHVDENERRRLRPKKLKPNCDKCRLCWNTETAISYEMH